MNMLERFTQYVTIDTQSALGKDYTPSTEKQHDLARFLEKEMKDMGISNVKRTDTCYVYGEIPKNCDSNYKLGLIAHMDTSPDASGVLAKPTVVENYDGKDIVLSDTVISSKQFTFMKEHIGKTIICADGKALLGADDKAGIAIIMQTADYLLKHPEIKHGDVKIAFTPDEEVGNGVKNFDVKGFDCDGAYTVDGGELGGLECENFNAASAKISIKGMNVHPGYAKGYMVNALTVAVELDSLLGNSRPQTTEGYEGFFHLTQLSGEVEWAQMQYIIRDHDMQKFIAKKQKIADVAEQLNEKYGKGTVSLELKDSYFNMKEILLKDYHLVENAVKAYEKAGVKAKIHPIRGGTDGATLSFMGLPCPNISGCYYNAHGRYEFAVLDDMEKMVSVLLNLVDIYKNK